MSYAFDVPETHATEEEEVGEEGDDLVSDDEKTILSMIPLADMLCVYPCTLHGPLMFKILLRPFVSYSIYHLEFVLTVIAVTQMQKGIMLGCVATTRNWR